MSKELEAFERIKNITYDRTDLYGIEVFRKDLDIIEIALKDYEKKTRLAKEYVDVNNVAKRLKALEIIKKINKYNLRALIDQSFLIDETITFDEHDLLREVLL